MAESGSHILFLSSIRNTRKASDFFRLVDFEVEGIVKANGCVWETISVNAVDVRVPRVE